MNIVHRPSGNPDILTPAELLKKAATDLNIYFDLFCEDEYRDNQPHWAFDNYRLNGTIAKNPSKLFYTQPSWGKVFAEQFGQDKVKLVTYAVDKQIYPKKEAKQIYDVGFIGNVNDDDGRQEYLDALVSNFNCLISSSVPTKDITAELAKCKVVFNHIRYEEINIRFFEALASGCQVVSYSPTLHLFAKEGQDYVTYKTPEDAVAVIKELLNDDDRRWRMAFNGRRDVMANHTYRNRVKEMIDFI